MPPLDKATNFRESIETKSQLAFIRDVFEKKLPVCLWGGYADDALLHQSISRKHSDVDLAAFRTDSELLRKEFLSMGLKVEYVAFVKGETPYKLLVTGEHMHADVALFDTDEKGNPVMDIYYPRMGAQYRVDFDPNVLQGIESQLEGVSVTTVSPLALIRSKDAYFQAGVGPSRKKDVAGKQALLAQFFPDEDPNSDKFKLQIARI